MKRTIALVLATLTLLPAADMAQTFTFTTNSSPGVTVSTSPFGTGIGVSTPLFNTDSVSYTHSRAHETDFHFVCRLLRVI